MNNNHPMKNEANFSNSKWTITQEQVFLNGEMFGKVIGIHGKNRFLVELFSENKFLKGKTLEIVLLQ